MAESLESALRQLIKGVAREVADEFLRELQVPKTPPALKPLSTENNLLVNSHEAAKRLSISGRSLSKLTHSGAVPCVRIGRSVRYSVDSLQKWIRCSETTTPAAPKQVLRKQNASLINLESDISSEPTSKSPKKRQGTKTRRDQSLKPLNTPVAPARQSKRRIEEERRHTPFADLLKEIGVERSTLPEQAITHGYLKTTAEVDTATLHGWLYRGGSLPEMALERLRVHFRTFVNRENDSDGTPNTASAPENGT